MAFRRLRAILEAPEDLRNTLEEAVDKAREIVPEQVQIDQNDYFVFETELKFQVPCTLIFATSYLTDMCCFHTI